MGYAVIIMLITFTSHKFSWYPIYVRSKWESRYIFQSALMEKQIHNYWSAGKTEIFFSRLRDIICFPMLRVNVCFPRLKDDVCFSRLRDNVCFPRLRDIVCFPGIKNVCLNVLKSIKNLLPCHHKNLFTRSVVASFNVSVQTLFIL